MKLLINPLAKRDGYTSQEALVTTRLLAEEARREISQWPGYGTTPLRSLEAVAAELCEIDARDRKQPAGFLAHRVEHDGRFRALRHQGGYPPQRRLLVGEPVQLLPCLGIRDRGREELGELTEPGLGIGRQPDCGAAAS